MTDKPDWRETIRHMGIDPDNVPESIPRIVLPNETELCKYRQDNSETDCNGWLTLDTGTMRCKNHMTGACPLMEAGDAKSQFLVELGFGLRYSRPNPQYLFGNKPEHELAAENFKAFIEGMGDSIANGMGLCMAGKPGVGKSFALALIALRARWLKIDAAYIYIPDLYTAIHDRDWAVVRRCENVQLLLLDDVGASYDVPWPLTRFNSLFEQRYANFRTTCLSSNYTLETLKQREGYERITSRIYESCKGHILTFGSNAIDLREYGIGDQHQNTPQN